MSERGCFHVCCEWTVVTVAIVVSIGLFSIPTVIFFVYRDTSLANWRESIGGVNSQLHQYCQNNTSIAHKDNYAGNQSNTNVCVPYDRKGVCYTNLQSVLRERGVISSNLTVTTNGRDVSQLENVLNTGLSSPLLSTSCKQKGFPLYCQFLFPPCSHGESLLLTRDKCNMLRNVYCEKEVNFVQRFRNTALYKRFSFLDPNCSTFSQQIHNSSRLYKAVNVSQTSTSSPLTCHHRFIEVCSLCLPSCTNLYFNKKLGKGLQVDDVAKITAPSLTVIGALIFLVLALLKRKDVFTFPTILVFYETVIELLVALIILTPFIVGRGRLLCSYPDVLRTLNYPPTTYCTICGFLFHFGIMVPILMWVMHLIYITVLLAFPIFGERKLKKWSRIIHALIVTSALLLSLIGPISVVSTTGYVTITFPPVICYPGSMNAVFYSMIFPSSILFCTGVILMILIIRQIHKAFHSPTNELRQKLSSARTFFSPPEIKIIVLSMAFVLLSITVMGTLSHSIATRRQFTQELVAYSLCQLHGDNPSCTLRSEDVRIMKAVMNAAAYFSIAVVVYVNIFFILKISDFTNACDWIRDFYEKVKKKCCVCSYYR